MIKITSQSQTFSKVDVYKLTQDKKIKTISKIADGTILKVNGWIAFLDMKKEGEEPVAILSLMCEDGVYSCQSVTFKNSFYDIWNIFNNADDADADEIVPVSIEKISGSTKAGRPYIDCALAY